MIKQVTETRPGRTKLSNLREAVNPAAIQMFEELREKAESVYREHGFTPLGTSTENVWHALNKGGYNQQGAYKGYHFKGVN